MQIETSAPKVDRSLTVEYNFGGSLDAAVSMFGAEVVYSQFEDSGIIALQGLVRRNLERRDEKRKSDEEIQAIVAAWKPGVASVRVDAVDSLIARFSKMTPEKQAELLAKLRGGV